MKGRNSWIREWKFDDMEARFRKGLTELVEVSGGQRLVYLDPEETTLLESCPLYPEP